MKGIPPNIDRHLPALRRWLPAAAFLAVAALGSLVTPYISKVVVDRVILAGEAWLLWPILGVALAVYGLRSLCEYWGKTAVAELAEGLWHDLRNIVFEKLQSLSLEYHVTADVGDHVARVQYDTFSVKRLVGTVLPSLVRLVVGVGGTAVILLVLAPKLTLLAFIALPPAMLAGWIFRDKVRPLSDKISEYRGDVYSAAYESLSSIEDVKSYRGEAEFEQRFRRAGRRLEDVEVELARQRATLLPTVNFGISLVLVTILGFGGKMALSGTMSVGTLVAFYFYVSRSLGPLRQIPGIVFGWYRARAAMDRIDTVLASEDALGEADEPRDVPQAPTLAFEDVEFAYRDRQTDASTPALQGVNLTMQFGERVALLGPSGSGKSTTGKLVPRLFDPQAGRVTADGIPLERFRLSEWRRRVGYVGQEVSLFRGTIRENICFASDGPVSDTALEKAVCVAGLCDVADAKADGLESLVGEGGGKLSGGQRKRVALARALVRQPDILVVDQFAADIERDLCRRIFEGVRREYDLSILYLGHRIPAGFAADAVFWMEHGTLEPYENDDVASGPAELACRSER